MTQAAGETVTAELSEALHAVGAMLGFPVSLSEHDEWELTDQGLRVGLWWYQRRGYSVNETIALAVLQLWEGPRDTVYSATRARRRTVLERALPSARPLIGAVRRAQAAAEVLRSLPGLRVHLQAAMHRALPEDLSTLPRHLQLTTLVLSGDASGQLLRTLKDSAVAEEWRKLGSFEGQHADAVQHVLAPDTQVTPLRRFERALALLLPGYERLLALDIADHSATILGGSDRAELSLQSEQPLRSDDFETGDARSGDHDQDQDQDDPADTEDGVEDASGTDPEAAELFASEHENFETTMLSTPVPEATSLFDAAVDLMEAEWSENADHVDRSDARSTGQGVGAADGILAEYRLRTSQLAAQIDAMRGLWTRILAERVAVARSWSRTAKPQGEMLAAESLARIVADTLAGTPEPDAFLTRSARPHLTNTAGSTDYVLLLDRSASMSGVAAGSAADAALIMMEALAAVERDISYAESLAGIGLELDIRTSLIVFDAEAIVVKPLSHGLDDLVRRRLYMEVLSSSGATNDAAGLRSAGLQLGLTGSRAPRTEHEPRRRIVFLVSDGGSNDPAAARRELLRLRAAGVTVYGIGLGAEELVVRYAPNGINLADPRGLPGQLERVIEFELG